jgi:hypothetical protein
VLEFNNNRRHGLQILDNGKKYICLAILYIPPILNLVVFYTYVCRTAIYLGHFPSYGEDSSPGSGLHALIIYALFYFPIISLIAISVFIILSFVLKGNFFKNLFIHCMIALALIIYYYFMNPYMEWFLD